MYILFTGAPGSRWSSVAEGIYRSPDIDQTDADNRNTYRNGVVKHQGAYFDPGMEFGDWFDELDKHTKEECEAEFDKPFSGDGVRVVKSHVFAHHINFIKEHWPDCPIVLVHRDDDACLGWWVRCGEFDITYPLYHKYYQNLKEMGKIINHQNKDILTAWYQFKGKEVYNNVQLAEWLHINIPPEKYRQNYNQKNVKVKVL